MPVIVDKWITVLESDHDVDTNILLRNNDWIDISASGSIWAGVWFTGENGPRGWAGWSARNDCPPSWKSPVLIARQDSRGWVLLYR